MRNSGAAFWCVIGLSAVFLSVGGCTAAVSSETRSLQRETDAARLEAPKPPDEPAPSEAVPPPAEDSMPQRLSDLASELYRMKAALKPAAIASDFRALHPDADPNDLDRLKHRAELARRLFASADRDLETAARLLDLTYLDPQDLKMLDAEQRLHLSRRDEDLALWRLDLVRSHGSASEKRLADLNLEIAELRTELAHLRGEMDYAKLYHRGSSSEAVDLATSELEDLAADLLSVREQECKRLRAAFSKLAALGFRKEAAAGRDDPEIPEFRLPPPKASATALVQAAFLVNAAAEKTLLADVDRKLCAALDACGYFERSYYRVPDGFAMATRLEQINPDGTSRPPPGRWAAEIQPLRRFSLKEYLKALFGANEGYYRIIVFVITPEDFWQEDRTVSRDEAEAWIRAGANKLPEAIGRLEYTQAYACTALIYEFRQSDPGREPELSDPSDLLGRTHLEKANLWQAMEN